jgi:transcriptional regulator with GAF, ATPase, and Fis domain
LHKVIPFSLSGIIGSSMALAEVLSVVRQVAPTQATVLVCGETGTGKERVARAVHDLSPRSHKPFVTLNCAALPSNLIESELFGHEKGAFTGASERRTGKFELANGGTIFLDEIGELPLDLQSKLLRVLQERELERLGGKITIPLDVRVVAATNRDLQKEVVEGRFRADVYYRLNVLPLLLPPLRDRREDIPHLAYHFLQKYALRLGKTIHSIDAASMQALMRCSWQGNIRELENVMERSVILCNGETLRVEGLQGRDNQALKDFTKDFTFEMKDSHTPAKSLGEAERETKIANTLQWKVFVCKKVHRALQRRFYATSGTRMYKDSSLIQTAEKANTALSAVGVRRG